MTAGLSSPSFREMEKPWWGPAGDEMTTSRVAGWTDASSELSLNAKTPSPPRFREKIAGRNVLSRTLIPFYSKILEFSSRSWRLGGDNSRI
jgi:hypothetical protein